MVKKLFLVFCVLLAGMTGLSAAPLRPGGGNDAPLMVIPQVDITLSIAAPVTPAMTFVIVHESAVAQDLELICLWFGQYQEGLLTADEFTTLVAGRAAVMYMREQTTEAIRRIASLTLAEYPLLC
jgi:hypothetical protein